MSRPLVINSIRDADALEQFFVPAFRLDKQLADNLLRRMPNETHSERAPLVAFFEPCRRLLPVRVVRVLRIAQQCRQRLCHLERATFMAVTERNPRSIRGVEGAVVTGLGRDAIDPAGRWSGRSIQEEPFDRWILECLCAIPWSIKMWKSGSMIRIPASNALSCNEHRQIPLRGFIRCDLSADHGTMCAATRRLGIGKRQTAH